MAYYKSLFKNNELYRMYKSSYTTFADPFTYEMSIFIYSTTLDYTVSCSLCSSVHLLHFAHQVGVDSSHDFTDTFISSKYTYSINIGVVI